MREAYEVIPTDRGDRPLGPAWPKAALVVAALVLALAAILLARPETASAAPEDDPGGPILVVGDESNPFSLYYAEILRNEGLNEFDTLKDSASLSAATLRGRDVVILGDVPLGGSQVTALEDWVRAGGNLIAMRPDANLTSLLGLSGPSGTLSEGYLRVNTSQAPGRGIVGETIQYHGAADRYSLSGGAREVAALYSSASTATSNPAVTLRDVGTNGGQAAAFTYDLARSVVYTRQGNPEWAGQNRDSAISDPGLRPNDLFYPNWVNLNKVAIP